MNEPEFAKLIASIEDNSCGVKLDLSYKEIDDKQIARLAHALMKNTILHSLTLNRTQIGDAGAKALAEALAKNATLHSLDLSWNQIGEAGVKALAEALVKNTTLYSVNLSWNQIGDAGVKALAEALAKNATLHSLSLRENKIGDAGAKALAEALAKNATLHSLSLGDNQIGEAGVKALAEALAKNATLHSLDLCGNRTGHAGAKALAEALAKNATLHSLSLWGNQIGDAGVKALAEALAKNATLHSLDLGYNQIGDAGVKALAEVLVKNTILHSLTLSWNQIRDAGAKALAEALAKNATLHSLHIDSNWIGDAGTKALAEALVKNTILHSLDLSGNEIGDAGAKALAEALVKNTILYSLGLGRNQIRDAGAKALAEALAKNATLHSLSLRENKIGDAGAKALVEALAKNTILHSLDLYGNKISDMIDKQIKEIIKAHKEKAASAHEKAFAEISRKLEMFINIKGEALKKLGKINFLKQYQNFWIGGRKHLYCLDGAKQELLQDAWRSLIERSETALNHFDTAVSLSPAFPSPVIEHKTRAEIAVQSSVSVTTTAVTSLATETQTALQKVIPFSALATVPRIAWKELIASEHVLVGQGSYGKVYKAEWQGVTVAIKTLLLEILSPPMLKEFEHESDMMMKCQHPSIVRLYGVCTESGHLAMVMDYLPMSLRTRLQEGREFPWLKRLMIAQDMAKGLAYLHSRSILHRDLKSLNILLDEQERARIADFGLAKLKLEIGSTSTKSHKAVGSIRWRAPELFNFPPPEPNTSSDVYSLGMLLWELASRRLPYSHSSDETMVGMWIGTGKKEKIPDDCPKAFAEIIEACCSAPEKRPSASEVVSRLEPLIEAERKAAKEQVKQTAEERLELLADRFALGIAALDASTSATFTPLVALKASEQRAAISAPVSAAQKPYPV